jgi:hypothetical protein
MQLKLVIIFVFSWNSLGQSLPFTRIQERAVILENSLENGELLIDIINYIY